MRNGEEEKADGKCQMPDGKCQMPDGKCQMPDDGCRTGDDSGEPAQEECPAPQNVQNEANLESTQTSLLLEVESSTTEPAGQKRSQFTQVVASEDGVASGEWRVKSE